MSIHLSEVREEIADRIAGASYLLICVDFDGTLTPIVQHPALAELSSPMRAVLQALAVPEEVSVAVISGRECGELQSLVGIPGLIYGGNHGLEIRGPDFSFVEPTAQAHRESLRELAETLASRLQAIPGTFVEDKGLTLSIHYRRAAAKDFEEVRRTVHATLAGASHPFLLTTGDKVYEVRPRVYWDKGVAVGWIKEQLGQPDALTVYVGDDTTDEDAFAALTDGITVKVGGAAETAACYHLDGQPEVRGFLEWLAALVRQPRCVTMTQGQEQVDV
jgi:trehalose 6-phosphate phosphatase